MNEFNDDLSLLGDWMLPSPSPRFSFSSVISDEGTSTVQESGNGNNKCIAADGNNNTPVNALQVDQSQGNSVMNVSSNTNDVSDDHSKSSSRGGLMERMALRAGFNAPRLDTGSIKPTDPCKNPQVRYPYLTIPPGLSPTCLLESPVFLSNSLVQPSPTTGKFSFTPFNGNNQNSSLTADNQNKGKEKILEDDASIAFGHVSEHSSIPNHDAASKLNVDQNKAEEKISGDVTSFASRLDSESGSLPQFITPNIALSSGFPSTGVNSHLHQNVQPQNLHCLNNSMLFEQANASRQHVQNIQTSNVSSEQNHNAIAVPENNSSPFDEPNEDDGDQRSGGTNTGGSPAEDGYNWRKYGQKQVKGSEHPRGYYKCTHLDCPVKKKVERSPEGHITEIIYKGAHNHPKPEPNRRMSIGGLGDAQIESEQPETGADNGGMQVNIEELSSSLPLGQDGNNGFQNGTRYQLENGITGSTSFSNDEDDEDRATRGSVSLGRDDVEDESESKRRRVESYTAAEMTGAMRAIREPRVVVQTTSDVDILDDGYRWRKYGQKVVKGNPNPRSYYKCTSPGCNVRKHVERASHDLKSVITTYEGKHNHDVPAARNATHGNNSGVQNSLANQQAPDVPSHHHIHRPEPSQIQPNSGRLEHTPMGSFGGLPGFPPMGVGPRMGFSMNQAGFTGHGLGGLRQQNHGNLQMLSVNRNNPFFRHQPGLMSSNMMMPRPEPKPEPVMENGVLNTSTGGGGGSSSLLRQQFMSSHLPLGPQM